MCLILHRSTEPQIATEDITCYKIVYQYDDYHFSSIFFNHKWTYNELYSTDITVTNINENSKQTFKTYWNIDAFILFVLHKFYNNFKLYQITQKSFMLSDLFTKVK